MLHGHGAPSNSLGDDYNHYYDEDTSYVWEKNGGEWINRFTKGSGALFSENGTKKQLRRAVETEKEDLGVLKNALATSFYTTNGTVHMIPHWPNDVAGWDLLCEYSKNNFKATGDTTSEHPFGFYAKMDTDDTLYVYDESEKEYVEANSNHYCMLPHPTLENITFTNYLLYDDELGQQTAIVCGNLDKASYEEETGFYSIKNIAISHKAMTTRYIDTPTADEMVFDFSFKLSEDKTYVSKALLKFVSTTIDAYADDLPGYTLEYEFTNIHSTQVAMPE